MPVVVATTEHLMIPCQTLIPTTASPTVAAMTHISINIPEEQSIDLPQPMNAMQTDGCRASERSAWISDKIRTPFLVQLVTSEPQSEESGGSWRRGDSSHVKIARSGDEKHQSDDEQHPEVQGQGSDRIQKSLEVMRRNSESFTAFKM